MSVARSSSTTSSADARQSGCRSRAARPRSSTWSKRRTPAPVAESSKAMTWASPGRRSRIRVTFSSCAALETSTAAAPESRRMYSACLAGRVG